jgi:hypothetical protein
VIKSGRIGDGDFAKHLAIEPDIGLLTALDELAIPYGPAATGSTESGNPQTPEVPFTALAVNAGVYISPYHRLFGQPILPTGGTAVAFHRFEDTLP